jgi:branched-chain amino acid transport system permease protein
MNIIITGLITGSMLALLAIGFSLIFGVARIVNIAHTAFYMVAAYCIFSLTGKFGLNPVAGMMIAVMIVTVFGLLAYKFLIDPIREHEAAVLIATIALAMIFQEAVMLIYTGDYRTVSALIEGYFIVTGVKVFYQQLLTFGVVLALLAVLWFLLMKTKLGLAIRSTAEDREVANLMGMYYSRLAMITMGISVALAGFTGAVIAPLAVLSPFMWMEPLIMMMPMFRALPTMMPATTARMFLRIGCIRSFLVVDRLSFRSDAG